MSDDMQVRVTHVPDGDGIDGTAASGGSVRIRLHGIDAPELGQRNSLNSRNYLRYLVRTRCNGRVRVERMGVDRYGRIIGVVYPASESGNRSEFRVSLNELMVEAGLAYSIDEDYDDAEAEAQDHERGVWKESPEGQFRPWNYRDLQRNAGVPSPRRYRGAWHRRRRSSSGLGCLIWLAAVVAVAVVLMARI